MRSGCPSRTHMTIIPLKHADATTQFDLLKAFLTLAAFFDGDDGDIRVTVDEKANDVIISASEKRMQQAKDILRWLDVKDR
jgi:type II secretory pathway component GspD/PulD (secretin)